LRPLYERRKMPLPSFKCGKNKVNVDKKPVNEDKKRYMDSVYLTNEEHQKLVEKFGETQTKIWIKKLNNYIQSKGKRYKSHYHTILTWSRMDKEKKKSDNFYKGDKDYNDIKEEEI